MANTQKLMTLADTANLIAKTHRNASGGSRPEYDTAAGEYGNLKAYWDAHRDGRVYGARFPKYTYSNTPTGVKTRDNANLTIEISTNTTAGRDDYAALNAFKVFDVNATVDTDGKPHVTAISGLDDRYKADGTNKKPKRLFVILTLLMCAQVIWYAYSGNGFALVFAIVLGAMALVLRNSYQKANRAIAKAFEEEGDQRVIVGEEKLYLNEKEVAYSEIAHCYQLKHCFSIVYQGNHVYVIPKSVLNVEQAQELASLVQQKAPQAYHDLTQK